MKPIKKVHFDPHNPNLLAVDDDNNKNNSKNKNSKENQDEDSDDDLNLNVPGFASKKEIFAQRRKKKQWNLNGYDSDSGSDLDSNLNSNYNKNSQSLELNKNDKEQDEENEDFDMFETNLENDEDNNDNNSKNIDDFNDPNDEEIHLLNISEIEGQVFDSNDDVNELNHNDIVSSNIKNNHDNDKDEIPIEAFNLYAENKDGAFDNQGNYIRRAGVTDSDENDEEFAWLNEVSNEQIIKTAATVKAKKDMNNILETNLDSASKSDLYSKLISNLQLVETPIEALARLRKDEINLLDKISCLNLNKNAINSTSNTRSKIGRKWVSQNEKRKLRIKSKSLSNDDNYMATNNFNSQEVPDLSAHSLSENDLNSIAQLESDLRRIKESINEITTISDTLYHRNETDIYNSLRESLIRSYNQISDTPYSNQQQTKKRKFSEHIENDNGSNENGNENENNKNKIDIDDKNNDNENRTNLQDQNQTLWEFIWEGIDDIYGPYPASHMLAWKEAKYFENGNALIRKHGSNESFVPLDSQSFI